MPVTNEAEGNLPREVGLQELTDLANAGDQAALAELRRVLDENPLIWRTVGDLAKQARLVLARALAGGDQLALDSILRHANELEQEILPPNATALEKLAVGRIVACWLETQFAGIKSAEPAGKTIKQAQFALKVRESAERRFHAAIKSFALVRQLLGADEDRRRSGTPAMSHSAAKGNGNGTPGMSHSAANGNGTPASPATAPANANGSGNGHMPANRIRQFMQPKTRINDQTRCRLYRPSDRSATPRSKAEEAFV